MEAVKYSTWTHVEPLKDALITRDFLNTAVELALDGKSGCKGWYRQHMASTAILVMTVGMALITAISYLPTTLAYIAQKLVIGDWSGAGAALQNGASGIAKSIALVGAGFFAIIPCCISPKEVMVNFRFKDIEQDQTSPAGREQLSRVASESNARMTEMLAALARLEGAVEYLTAQITAIAAKQKVELLPPVDRQLTHTENLGGSYAVVGDGQ